MKSKKKRRIIHSSILLILNLWLIAGCFPLPEDEGDEATYAHDLPAEETRDMMVTSPTPVSLTPVAVADVLSVTATGMDNDYRFSVEISSPDTGCDQYADWWEVLTSDGVLIYRRILLHSHRDEQPFIRSGGPVNINGSTTVIIRAHMHPTGYGGVVMRGSVESGFEAIELPVDFARETEYAAPLPDGCAF
jgi:hypothetical protein